MLETHLAQKHEDARKSLNNVSHSRTKGTIFCDLCDFAKYKKKKMTKNKKHVLHRATSSLF